MGFNQPAKQVEFSSPQRELWVQKPTNISAREVGGRIAKRLFLSPASRAENFLGIVIHGLTPVAINMSPASQAS